MAVLREETRNRWSALAPDKFISTVLYGALGDQLKLAYTFIAVEYFRKKRLPKFFLLWWRLAFRQYGSVYA